MKKVLIITTHFAPDRHVGARRPTKFARYLPEYGWIPVVLTVPVQELGDGVDESSWEDLSDNLNLYRVSGWSRRGQHSMVETIVSVVGKGKVEHLPWPDDYEHNETGDYVADITKVSRMLGWTPRVDLVEGIRRTHRYYVEHKEHYFWERWEP